MTIIKYPQIFYKEDSLAARSKKRSARAVVIIGLLAVLHEMFALISGFAGSENLYILTRVLIAVTTAVLGKEIFNSTQKKYADSWYDSRAAAESIKTVYFRYLTCADPFRTEIPRDEAEEALLTRLETVLLGLGKSVVQKDQLIERSVLDWAWSRRTEPLSARMEFYLSERIEDQLNWYSSKSSILTKLAERIKIVSIASTMVSLFFAIVSIFLQGVSGIGGFFLIFAVLIFGFGEVQGYKNAHSYKVTHAEILEAKIEIQAIKDDQRWSEYVDDIEEAFSREHVTWRASKSRSL